METGGVKGVCNSDTNTTSRHELICQPSSISAVKLLVKNENSESLASYLRNLCGANGHAQIVGNQDDLQIHLFFDSQRQRDLFKQELEDAFKDNCDHTLTFEDSQTQDDPQQPSLYPLKLNASQSVALLYDTGVVTCILREIQGHLDLTKISLHQGQIIPFNTNAPNDLVTTASPSCSFDPGDNSKHLISGFCWWLPPKSVLNYAATCRSALQFIMGDEFWKSRALVHGIQLNPVISFKLQMVAWEQAKFFEDKYKSVLDYEATRQSAIESIMSGDDFWNAIKGVMGANDLSPQLQGALKQANSFGHEYQSKLQEKSSHFRKAAEYYLTAAKLGVPEAITWLEATLASATLLTSTQHGEIFLVLGDWYAKMENPDLELVQKYHASAWKLLIQGAHDGCSNAILVLYNRDIGAKLASQINESLEAMLLDNMKRASSKVPSLFSKQWILNVFSRDAKLPLYFKKRSEQALLIVFNEIKFNTASDNYHYAHQLVNEREFDQIRLLIDATLNKLFGTQDNSIALCYSWFDLPTNKILISPMDQNDTARFIEKVAQSDLAPFFVPLTKVPSADGLADENCIVITEESWDQFKALICK